MTPIERRGRRLLAALAVLLATQQVLTLGLALSGGQLRLRPAVQSLGLIAAVYYVWQGETWLRWLLGGALAFTGGLLAFVTGRVLFDLAAATPPAAAGFFVQVVGLPVGVPFALGLFDLAAGLVLLLSPAVRAFARYQREGSLAGGGE